MDTKLLLKTTWRRSGWLFARMRPGPLWNMTKGALQFATRRERVTALPVLVKIDISPLCNLSCTICLHADPNGNERLETQEFKKDHKMTVAQYRRIIDEIKGKSLAVSLYAWGDPLVHPDLDEMCRIGAEAGLQVHISTNFSFSLTEQRIERLVTSGLSHLVVCVDGLSQEKYQRTRVGGRIEWVLQNLKRACEIRRRLGTSTPQIEVQFIKYQHNLDEVQPARELCLSYGVDQFTEFWGALHNYTDWDPGSYHVFGPKKSKATPRCYWPHFSTVIKYNGDVIPCCSYRRGAQYRTNGDDPRVLGNVFETSFEEVWNSEAYRASRRLVSNPERVRDEPELERNFCHGCPVVFETDFEEIRKIADQTRWEDLYVMNERGRPVRKAESRVRLLDPPKAG